jgi:hypothetical protein
MPTQPAKPDHAHERDPERDRPEPDAPPKKGDEGPHNPLPGEPGGPAVGAPSHPEKQDDKKG